MREKTLTDNFIFYAKKLLKQYLLIRKIHNWNNYGFEKPQT